MTFWFAERKNISWLLTYSQLDQLWVNRSENLPKWHGLGVLFVCGKLDLLLLLTKLLVIDTQLVHLSCYRQQDMVSLSHNQGTCKKYWNLFSKLQFNQLGYYFSTVKYGVNFRSSNALTITSLLNVIYGFF